MNVYQEILEAKERIQSSILKTPLFYSTYLSKLNQGEVYLKLESEQYTGSFKVRGALNKVLKLSTADRKKGLVTASTGNHAQGFARALTIARAKGTIFLPTNAEPSKVEALKYYDADLQFHGDDPLPTELHAIQVADETGKTWVSEHLAAAISGDSSITETTTEE